MAYNYSEPPTFFTQPLEVPFKLLMGPGPSNPYPRVLQALSHPILGHMHTETFKVMDEIKEGLRYVFQTTNELTLAVSASGHGGMEATLCNLLEEGDTALIAVNGIWGERAAKIATNYGARVHTIRAFPGDNFTLVQIELALDRYRPTVLFVTQGESSTGVYQNLEGIGPICRRFNCLLVVDTVASLGGVPLFTDKWGIDAVYTGSQKVLGSVTGLAPMSFSRRAVDKIFKRKAPPKVFYWDMTQLGDQWGCFGNPRFYHHTTSTPLLFALREGLAIIAEEGLSNLMRRHQSCAQRLYDGLENKLHLEFFVGDVDKRLPTVTAVKVPEDVRQWQDVTNYAMQHHRVEISGGLGPSFNKVFRIGLMGYNATPEKVDRVLQILKEGLEFARAKNAIHKL